MISEFEVIHGNLGQFLICMLPNMQVAQVAGTLLVTIWNQFCGFLVPEPSIPRFWIWLYWVNPLRFVLEGLCTVQFHCDGGITDCPTVTLASGISITKSAFIESVQSFGMNYDNRWIDVGVLLIFAGFFRLGTFLALRYVRHISR